MSGRITALKFQKRNRERVNVHIDGRFAFGLAVMEAAQLQVGQHVSDAEIARLKDKDQAQVAFERALKFLSYRPRSVAEMRRYLAEKEFDEPAIEQALERLSQLELVDDEAFARYWLENRDSFKPRGCRALSYELRQRGIADAIIQDLLADYDESDAAYRVALSWAQKKMTRQHDVQVFRTKLLAFLNRRGFAYDIARDAVDRVLSKE